MKQECPICNGVGWTPIADGPIECDGCGGTGEIDNVYNDDRYDSE